MGKQATSITKNKLMPCPDKLSNLLSVLNLLPPNEDLRTLDIGSQKFLSDEQLYLQALHDLEVRIKHYPMKFREFIYGREVDFQNFAFVYMYFLPNLDYWETYEAIIRYEDFIQNRRRLKGIIQNVESSLNNLNRELPYLFQPRSRMRIDEKGKIHFSLDKFLEALEGVEISRIKNCKNCCRIFWQGRKDQKACNPQCANNLRVKNSRENKRKNRVNYDLAAIKKHKKQNNTLS